MATHRVARIVGWDVSENDTNVVCQVKFSNGRDETDGVSIPHDPSLSNEECAAKIIEGLTMFEPLGPGDTFRLLDLGGVFVVGGA